MPTYQYACKNCDYEFEQVQAFSDPALTACPRCAGQLRKVYGSVGVVFKGSGFYRTDSRSGASKSTLSAEHKAESNGSSGNGSTEHKSTEHGSSDHGSGKAAKAAPSKVPAGASSGSSAPAKAAS